MCLDPTVRSVRFAVVRRRQDAKWWAAVRCAVVGLLLAPTACGPSRIPLVVYSPHGSYLLGMVERAFEAQHPDVDVRWLDMGSQEVLDRLRAEKANPQADVWFGGPVTIFARGVRDSLLEPYRPSWAAATDRAGWGPNDAYFAVYSKSAVTAPVAGTVTCLVCFPSFSCQYSTV